MCVCVSRPTRIRRYIIMFCVHIYIYIYIYIVVCASVYAHVCVHTFDHLHILVFACKYRDRHS